MEKSRTNKPRKGFDIDTSMAWYNPGGCPLRVWPASERKEDSGEKGPGKSLIQDISPSQT